MIFHLRQETLARYADGTLPSSKQARVALHIAVCDRCRGEVAAYQKLTAAVKTLPPMHAPPMRDSIDAPPVQRHTFRAPQFSMRLAASIAIVAGAVLFGLLSPDEVVSNESDLTFLPARPTAGSEVTVRYRPSIELTTSTLLRLRARFRSANDAEYNNGMLVSDVVTLVRGRDGQYHGKFLLPDSAVYAVFAVENEAATVVDSNRRRGWDILVHDRNGKPTFAAFRQRAHDQMGRSWEEAYRTTVQMSEVYPRETESWMKRVWYEAQLQISGDTVVSNRLSKLSELHARLSGQPSVSADDASNLMYLAEQLKDTVVAGYWLQRMGRETPEAWGAVHRHTDKAYVAMLRQQMLREALMAELERLWQLSRGTNVNPLSAALSALQPGDSAQLVLRWIDRQQAVNRFDDGAETLLRFEETRAEGLRRIEARIARLESAHESERGLFSTRAADRRSRIEPQVADAYAALGSAMVTAGNVTRARESLARASGGWSLWRHRSIAQSYLGMHDTLSAAAMLARLAVDPATARPAADSLRGRVPTVSDESWERLRSDAAAQMRRATLSESVRRTLLGDVVLDRDGGTVAHLSEIADGRPSVVVLWSYKCGPARAAVKQIAALEAALAAEGVKLIMVSEDPPSADMRAYLATQKDMPSLWFDSRRDAKNAFGSFGTPSYFILDATGTIRFEFTELSNIRRQLAVLGDSMN